MKVEHKSIELGNMREFFPKDISFTKIDNCPVCLSTDLTDIAILKNSLTFSWCRNCAHSFHRRLPNKEWFQNWYESSWDKTDNKGNVPIKNIPLFKFKRYLKSLIGSYVATDKYLFCKDIVKQNNHVLDIGCGYGMNLLSFKKHNCKIYGLELSEHRAEFSRKLGIDARHVKVEDLNHESFNQDFDLIISNHVLEHVINPHSFMESIKRVLKPNGHICISVPNFDNDFLYQQFFFLLHSHCFTKSSLTSLLIHHGFVIRRIQEDNQIRVLAYYDPEHAKSIQSLNPSNGACDPPKKLIFNRTFGSNYLNQKNKQTTCQWSVFPGPERIEHAYKIEYSLDDQIKQPKKRIVQYQWSGSDDLPIEFSHSDGDVAFWVK